MNLDCSAHIRHECVVSIASAFPVKNVILFSFLPFNAKQNKKQKPSNSLSSLPPSLCSAPVVHEKRAESGMRVCVTSRQVLSAPAPCKPCRREVPLGPCARRSVATSPGRFIRMPLRADGSPFATFSSCLGIPGPLWAPD